MSAPVISIVIPTYNCAPYLRDSVDSVLAQAGSDVEVIVVDDGSTDDTASVLAEYGACVRVMQGPHRGLAAARNVGLAQAGGEWIAFHDADDVALPDRLEFPRAVLATQPDLDAVFCNGERVDAAGVRLIPPGIAARTANRVLTVAELFDGYPVYFQGALVRRAAFERTGPFDVTLRVQPDIEYAYRLFPRCRARFVDRVVFRYRWHSTNNSGDWLGSREDLARILEGLLRDHPDAVRVIGRRRIQAALARHYFRIAGRRLARGEPNLAAVAAGRAVELRPLYPRYRWRWLWQARPR